MFFMLAKLYKKINEFLHIANSRIKMNKHKEALLFLQQSEKILEVSIKFLLKTSLKIHNFLYIVCSKLWQTTRS